MTDVLSISRSVLEVELSLAGEILYMGQDTLPVARDMVPPEAFQSEQCRAIFRAACRAQDHGKPVEAYSVREELDALGLTVSTDFCAELSYYATTAANVVPQCKALLNAYSARKLRELLSSTLLEIPEGGDVDETVAELQTKLKDICGTAESAIISAEETSVQIAIMRDNLENGASAFVETGFSCLDSAFGGGLMRGGFYIVAARPGVGKTAMCIATAAKACDAGKRVLIVSLEMTPIELTARYLAMKTGIGSTKLLMQPHLRSDEYKRLGKALDQLPDKGPMYNRRHSATVSDIAFMARRAEADLLIIDYLGLIKATEGRGRYEQITGISNQLKVLAMDLNIPILCAAQLNRQTQSIYDEPSLSDLRDSGAIEQDADGVMLLYRASKEQPDGTTLLAATVAKNRHGKAGDKYEFLYVPRTNAISETPRGKKEQAPANAAGSAAPYGGGEELPF